ncbi:MAG: hypothetical protein IKY66_10440 [Bacteroidales bacterium]|nr:hypothetical protein [Bacteroidales bacterium]
MKRFISVSICLVLSAIAVSASEKANEFKYYHRGVFVSLDFAPGAALNARTVDRERNSSSGTDVAIGYRFLPQLAVALGTGAHGYSNRTWTCGDTVPRKVENTCVPVFVRVRCDFRDREVSPYVQVDLGYSFMEMYTRESLGRVKVADDRFTNGRYEYVEMNDSYIQYGMKGCFASLDLGLSLHVIGRARMNLALCGGIHQAFLGTAFQIDEGAVLNFGREDYLVNADGTSQFVRTVGSPDFKQTLEPFARFKISFTF